jgi:putative nucleotidyltransferase with HDIG domain
VSLLGVKEVSNLALGISTINLFKDIPPELIDMRTFWKNSISVGIFSKLLAARVRGANTERLFTGGLLHDVGRLILFKKLPYASTQALIHARSNMLPVVDAEADVFGYDHTEVGRTLLTAWNFPQEMIDLVRHHHSPMEAPPAGRRRDPGGRQHGQRRRDSGGGQVRAARSQPRGLGAFEAVAGDHRAAHGAVRPAHRGSPGDLPLGRPPVPGLPSAAERL